MHVYKDAMESSAFLGFSHRVKHPKGGSTGFLLNYPDQNLLETLQVFFWLSECQNMQATHRLVDQLSDLSHANFSELHQQWILNFIPLLLWAPSDTQTWLPGKSPLTDAFPIKTAIFLNDFPLKPPWLRGIFHVGAQGRWSSCMQCLCAKPKGTPNQQKIPIFVDYQSGCRKWTWTKIARNWDRYQSDVCFRQGSSRQKKT